jgi:hypothetical protein
MNSKQRLEQRRALLMTECSLQRTLLVAQARQLGLSTGLIKSGEGLLDRFKQIPGWAGLLVSVIMIFVPGKAAALARNGLMLMQILKSLRKKDPEG